MGLRRYLAIKNINSTQEECDGGIFSHSNYAIDYYRDIIMILYYSGSSEYPSVTCENTTLLGYSVCPNGYQLNLSSVACTGT